MVESNPVRKLGVSVLALLALTFHGSQGIADDLHPSASTGKEIVVKQARFTVITPQCVRMEYSPSGKFVDEPSYFAANRGARYTGAVVRRQGDSVSIDTGAIYLLYVNDGRPFSSHNLKTLIRDGRKTIGWNPDLKNERNLGGAIRTLDVWDGAGPLDDGVLSRNGWYLIDDSKGPLLTQNWAKSRAKDAGTDWYLFGYGRDYKSAIRSLTTISGAVPLPRKYILGVWYSRYWPYTTSEYHDIVRQYSEHDFPLDVIVMDMDWHKDGWTGWSWNRNLISDPPSLLRWFHDQGLRVTLNVHPGDGVQPHEDMYTDFMQAMGEDPAGKKTIPFDAGNKKYMDTLFKYTHAPHMAEGVDFWWLDWQQSLYTRSIPDLTNLQWLNQYYSEYTAKGGKRGVSFSRWGGWGDQRHPVHFSGDSSTSWRMLQFEVPFTAASGNSGCFFWTHDIGGHGRGRNEESYVRWCQFGAFSAVMRSHSARDASLDRRPWTYPKWAENSMNVSLHLRSKLFPYTYSSVAESCAKSIPFIRPLYIDNPDEEAAYKQPQEYMYGDNILAAPIAEPGVGARRVASQAVWFPKGRWFNYYTGERFSDGGEHLVASAVDEFPLYVRGGAPVPMQDYTPRMGSSTIRNLIVRCYPGSDGKAGTSSLYEDDGITDSYKRGEYATTKLTYLRKNSRVMVTISPTKHSYKGQLAERSYTVELPCTLRARRAWIDGRPVGASYDETKRMNTITVSKRSIRRGCNVTVEVEESSPRSARMEAFARRVGLLVPSRCSTMDLLLQKALAHPGDLSARCILACAGAGVFGKIESPYGYPDSKSLRIYRPIDISLDDVSYHFLDADDISRRCRVEVAFKGQKVLSEVLEPGLDLPALKSRNAADSAKITSSSTIFPIGIFPGVWWLSNGKESEWVRFDWDSPKTVDAVALYDLGYWGKVLEGKLEFSDGTRVDVDEISTEPTVGKVVRFAPRTVSWMKFTVTKLSPDSDLAGLSQMVVLKSR